jgi:hypothetical protein
MPSDATATRLASTILDMTRARGPDSSICPSEAARAVGDADWRDLMPQTREVARDLARQGRVVVTAHGEELDPDEDWHGPVRIHSTG